MKRLTVIFLVLFISILMSSCTTTMNMKQIENQNLSQKIFVIERRGVFGNREILFVVVGKDGIPRAISSNQPLLGNYLENEKEKKGQYPLYRNYYHYYSPSPYGRSCRTR